MKKIRTILVDDEQVARLRLARLLRASPEIEIVAECENGTSAISDIRQHAPDLVFLDIQMPGMDGFDVVDALPAEKRPTIIFVTAYDEYAVRAFEACALDYLLKPVAGDRLLKALERVAERRGKNSAEEPEAVRDRFLVRNQGRVDVVAAAQIEWIEAAGNYAILHTATQNHIIRQTMTSLEASLPEDFFRVSRSAILNLRHVVQLDADAAGENCALLRGGERVPFTRKVSEVRARL
ncbi:MAG TPA: LytTR family DNA-binding domain-containing protein [Chthoniobacterales bacterium]